MDRVAELRRVSFARESDLADADGNVEFAGVLFAGGPDELTVQISASDERAVVETFLPLLERLLPHLDEMIAGLGALDADLIQVILHRGAVGLHFWSRGVNNEFTAIYVPRGAGWQFDSFGDIFG